MDGSSTRSTKLTKKTEQPNGKETGKEEVKTLIRDSEFVRKLVLRLKAPYRLDFFFPHLSSYATVGKFLVYLGFKLLIYFYFFLTYNRIFNYITLLSTDKLVNAVYIGHFHWLAGGSSTKGSHGFHWIIFLARLSSFSA